MAATLQKKCSGGIHFGIITKIITKDNSSKELFCNSFGQDGTLPELNIRISGKCSYCDKFSKFVGWALCLVNCVGKFQSSCEF